MKKIITLLGSVLLFTGLKAQKDSMIKKETTPAVSRHTQDSLKNTSGITVKQNGNVLSKGNNVLPSKAIIIPDTDKPPVKGKPAAKPTKY